MTILFSETLARATIYPVPHKTTAISYVYTPDRLTIAAHLKDKWTMINQETASNVRLLDEFYSNYCYCCEHEYYEDDNEYGRCASVENNRCVTSDTVCPRGLPIPSPATHKFSVAPTIFEIDLNIANSNNLFKHKDVARARIQGSKLENNQIYLTSFVETPPNVYVHPEYKVCWGNNTQPESLKGIVNVFFSSKFKDESIMNTLSSFKRFSTELRKHISADNFNYSPSRYRYITQTADALLLIHSGTQIAAFFQMIAAGFKPIPECSSIIMIPLVSVEIEHEGETYRGFKTPSDACNKKWFVSPSGEVVGQL